MNKFGILFTKTLVIEVIILFILILINPVITATGIDKDIDFSSYNSKKIELSDDYKEIITFIRGYAKINWIERRGFFRGEVNLTWDDYQIGLANLSGFRMSENGIEYYNELITEGFVYINYFIGFSSGISFPEFAPGILGIALGNIDWYK